MIFSEILSAKTPEVSLPVIETTPSLEIRRIEVNLTVENVESHSAFLSWRFFSLEEKQFLDGVQIRYFTSVVILAYLHAPVASRRMIRPGLGLFCSDYTGIKIAAV